MKSLIFAAALIGAALPAMAQTNVSINIGQPGFYGRIDLGDFREPPVYYAEPILVERHTRYRAEPMYLRVPPGHMKKWGKHCSRYNACGRQVYFVRDEWYNNTYAPRYRETHGGGGRHVEQRRNVVHFAEGSHRVVQQEQHHGGGKHHDKHHDKGHGKGHDKGDKHGGGHGNGKH